MPPLGVCCTHGTFGALVCQETTEQTCVEEFLGSWLGPGTVCDNQGENGNPFPCDINTPFGCCDNRESPVGGANCRSDLTTRAACEQELGMANAVWGGPPGCPVDGIGDSLVDCRSLVPCFLPPEDGQPPHHLQDCGMMPFEECIALGRCPQPNVSCIEIPHDADGIMNPVVSCCIEDPDTGIVGCVSGQNLPGSSWEGCLELGGFPRCPNFCFDNSDPGNPIPLVECGLTGACCLANGECGQADGAADCESRPGTYQGNGTTCFDSDCEEEEHPCCFNDGTCEENLTQLQCFQQSGQWFPRVLLCSDVDCTDIQGCHGPREAFYQPGDLAYTSALCETAIAGITKRNQVINHQAGDFPESDRRMELLTTHRIKGCYFGAQEEPCEYHYIIMSKRHDGYLVPMAWSEPNNSGNSDRELNRWNGGFFTKQVNDDETDDVFGDMDDEENERAESVRIRKGYLHARVGIEQEVWSELAIYARTIVCGIPI